MNKKMKMVKERKRRQKRKNGFIMKCIHCGGDVWEFYPYIEDNPYFGKIIIEGVPDERCTNCPTCYMTYESSQKVNKEYQKRIKTFLLFKHNPATARNEYYNAEETTKLLG